MNTHYQNSFLSNHQLNTTAYDYRMPGTLLYSAQRNLNDLILLINRLFEHHSRLEVVRIDLYYKKEVRDTVSIETVQRHREQLLGDKRRYPNELKGLVGYAWGLEQGEKEGGYHYHLLAFYNSAERGDDISLADALGNLWNSITNGYGYFHNSNRDKGTMEMQGCLGIGRIHRDDVMLRRNLMERVAPYITKKCTVFDIRSDLTESGDFRTYGRSLMPKPLDPDIARRGRPPAAHRLAW
jgi:hypothetical protein